MNIWRNNQLLLRVTLPIRNVQVHHPLQFRVGNQNQMKTIAQLVDAQEDLARERKKMH